jgi:hypothetical protein
MRSERAHVLAGEEITDRGVVFAFDKVKLTHPVADQSVPLYMGGFGPNMLRLSGELCDGTVASVQAGPKYVRWARTQIGIGAVKAGRDPAEHRLATFAIYCVAVDSKRAKDAVRELLASYLSQMSPGPLTCAYDADDRIAGLVALGGVEAVASNMPSEWIKELAITGDREECAVKIQRLHEAGTDSVALVDTLVSAGRKLAGRWLRTPVRRLLRQRNVLLRRWSLIRLFRWDRWIPRSRIIIHDFVSFSPPKAMLSGQPRGYTQDHGAVSLTWPASHNDHLSKRAEPLGVHSRASFVRPVVTIRNCCQA